ncbi:hypothetical protein F511_30430 [Dorcoceras hygrometricum]|uniref:Mediator of RNA polymerase II transcription subunit 1 n=1 Tax=Dorcoceras hygrometricum TaxID=472368 RepID=A0A2Z7AHH0_9LAMI|nr:hypothetical protein F511_30430 [Dorcoceras hygrometricum]
MDKSEPTLVPEWLKNSGNQSGGGSTLHSDDKSAPKLSRNNSFMSSNGHDFGRSSSSEKTTSSYFHRSSSSNGSGNLRSYNSFGRNRRDRDWEKDRYDSQDKDKSVSGDRWHRVFSDSSGNSFSGKFEWDGLRRSQSATSGPHGDTWTKKVVTDSSSAGGNNTNTLLTKGAPGGGVTKTRFERNFPSLGSEERAVIPEVGRVPSPGLSSAIQSLPIGTAAAVGGEKWTSALAEVPVIVGSNGIGVSSVTQSASTQLASSTTTTLNMAEAVAQGPSRSPAMPQISVGTQRLEELAIKQSRQLIPVTPSMPKTLVSNSSDKQKTKLGQQQHSINSLPINHSKSDMSKSSSNVGKLHVLKLTREKNGVAPVVKDNLSPTTAVNAVSSTLLTSPSVTGAVASKGPPNMPVLNRKPSLAVLEKRNTSQAQAQSRKEFFNLVRKKSMAISTSATDAENFSSVDSGHAVSPPPSETSEKEDVPAPNTSQIDDAQSSASLSDDLFPEKRDDVTCPDDTCSMPKYLGNGMNASMDPLFSEEEEAAFLRSLGWEENSDEGGLTEEEISSFFKDATKYNSKPALRILEVVQPKFIASSGISSGLSSSDAKLES